MSAIDGTLQKPTNKLPLKRFSTCREKTPDRGKGHTIYKCRSMHVQTNFDPILNERRYTCHYKNINAAEEHIIVVLIEFRTFKKSVDHLKASTEV